MVAPEPESGITDESADTQDKNEHKDARVLQDPP